MNDSDTVIICNFFHQLYGDNFQGVLSVWTKQDTATKMFAAKEIKQAARYCVERSGKADVYFAVGLMREGLTDGRGKAEDVIALPGVWLDVDIAAAGAHKSDQYPASANEAWKIIKRFPLIPTTVIHSGYGLHCYWLFPKLLEIRDCDERNYAQSLSRSFQQHMTALFKDEGYKLDNTSDLARVLRVPGTLNHKRDTPKQVKIILPKKREVESNE